MEKKNILPLEKNSVSKTENTAALSSCCGGTPTANADACCKLDEDKKADGEAGCGCNTASDNSNKKSSCC